MDSTEVVLRKESDGKGYYERCGAEAGMPELSRFFAMLSEDEVRHVDALRALQSQARVDLAESKTLEGAKAILRRLAMDRAPLSGFSDDLGAAMDFEADSARACGELARQASHRWEQELFLKIAAEDEVHFTLLEQVRELLQSCGIHGRRGDVN